MKYTIQGEWYHLRSTGIWSNSKPVLSYFERTSFYTLEHRERTTETQLHYLRPVNKLWQVKHYWMSMLWNTRPHDTKYTTSTPCNMKVFSASLNKISAIISVFRKLHISPSHSNNFITLLSLCARIYYNLNEYFSSYTSCLLSCNIWRTCAPKQYYVSSTKSNFSTTS